MRELTPELLVQAYSQGVFPMAETHDADQVYWVEPHMRGILPLGGFHISRSLRKELRKSTYKITLNQNFGGVMAACADRPETWINPIITEAYTDMNRRGLAHSIEVWNDRKLVGGVYGVALNGVFFGESMFSRVPSGSKIALAHLVLHLRTCGFVLFDTQFITPHLASLGGQEIPQSEFLLLLEQGISKQADIHAQPLTNRFAVG